MGEHEKLFEIQKIKMISLILKKKVSLWFESYSYNRNSGNLVSKLFSDHMLHTFHKGLRVWSRASFWFSAVFVIFSAEWNTGMRHLLSYAHFSFSIIIFIVASLILKDKQNLKNLFDFC
jgi:hypothetical protein